MDSKNNDNYNTLNIVKSMIYHLSINNLNKMAKDIIALPVKSVEMLDEITNIIYSRVKRKYNYTFLYADLCAYIYHSKSLFNQLEGSNKIFQKLLLKRCQEVFISYKSHHQDIELLKETFKSTKAMTQSVFKRQLNLFLFEYYYLSLANCKFLGELFRKEVLPVKIIWFTIIELSKEKEDLQIHCLCILLKLAGPVLSKIYNQDLKNVVNKVILFENEKIKNTKYISPELKSLILEVQNMHLNGWINEDPVQLIEKNVCIFDELPMQLKNEFDSKSDNVIAACIFEECYDILFNFVNNKNIEKIVSLLTNTNSWLHYNQVAFVVSMILVTLEESQHVRTSAGILLNYLVMYQLILKCSIHLGIKNVWNDLGIQNDFPNLSNLIIDITSVLKF